MSLQEGEKKQVGVNNVSYSISESHCKHAFRGMVISVEYQLLNGLSVVTFLSFPFSFIYAENKLLEHLVCVVAKSCVGVC